MTFTFEEAEADGEWSCESGVKEYFTLYINCTEEFDKDNPDSSTYGYAIDFDYWYGEAGEHTLLYDTTTTDTDSYGYEGDEFLGEETVTFTGTYFDSLDLYFTLESDEVASIYFFDPVYGTVFLYGSEGTYDPETYTANVNEYFDFVTLKIITLYTSDDTDTTGYDAMLAASCDGDKVAIGTFVCDVCGSDEKVYATLAHTFAEGEGLFMAKPTTNTGISGYQWTDPSCEAAGSYVIGCTGCLQEILVYGEQKTGHTYEYAIEVDEDANEITVNVECSSCGKAAEYPYALYVEYDETTMSGYNATLYHKNVNGYTGRTYYSAAGEETDCTETHWVLNPEVFYDGDSDWYLTMATYAVEDVEYDEKTGTWSLAEGATAADEENPAPTCVDGAYNVYTLESGYITDVIKENTEQTDGAEAVWYEGFISVFVMFSDCGETIVEIDTAGGAPEGHKFGVDVDGEVSPEAKKVVLSRDGTYVTAYFECTVCGEIEEVVFYLSDAEYAGEDEETAEAYADKNELENWYWGTEATCVTTGKLTYTFTAYIWDGVTVDKTGEPVYGAYTAETTLYSQGGDHAAAEKETLGVAYDAATDQLYYVESYTCALCGEYVVDSYEIFVYDEATAYEASGFGFDENDTTQVYAYFLELLESQIEAGAEGIVFTVDYDDFDLGSSTNYNGMTGTVEYLGYLFTYTYEYLAEDGVADSPSRRGALDLARVGMTDAFFVRPSVSRTVLALRAGVTHNASQSCRPCWHDVRACCDIMT